MTTIRPLLVLGALALLSGCSSDETAPQPPARTGQSSPGRPATQETPRNTADRTWTCPMHPDVRQSAPGRCPLCGMDLVAAAPSRSAPAQPSGVPEAHADHEPRHGGQLGMQGDVHIELVLDPAGRHRVYLSDSRRAPIPPSEATGAALRFAPTGGAAVETNLRAEPADGALVAERGLPVGSGDLTVRAVVRGERIAMDFQSPQTAAPPPGHEGHTHTR